MPSDFVLTHTYITLLQSFGHLSFALNSHWNSQKEVSILLYQI